MLLKLSRALPNGKGENRRKAKNKGWFGNVGTQCECTSGPTNSHPAFAEQTENVLVQLKSVQLFTLVFG